MNYYTINLEVKAGDGTTMDVPYLVSARNVHFPQDDALKRAISRHERLQGPELTGVYSLRSPQ